MKSRISLFVASLFLVLLSTNPSQGQVEAQAPPTSSGTPPGALTVALVGKVQVEGGADIAKDTLVVLECGSKVRASANVDDEGQFSLVLYGVHAAEDQRWDTSEITTSSLADCSVSARAAGYRSTAASLAGEHQTGIIQVGTLVLQRFSNAQSADGAFTVSAASLAAPDKAKRQFEKGKEQEKKGKWAAASDYFRKAIQVYPRFALAWLELGRTQVQQNDFTQAQNSFQQAASHDSNLVPAYFELARVQAEQREWKALAQTTGKMVQLAPNSSPMFWFLDAAANYNLQDFLHSESSATRGLRLDTKHAVPQLEYLYGLILGKHGDYSAAVEHIKTYLKLAPNAADGKNAQTALSEFERLQSKDPKTAERR
ncbi:MAG TPA: tetratricopeptide repeat protein [Terriglobales bacterium]|nr:tetratricopeptide repeat protein [Terriglobales bacterium]